jgi:hypothetical protein
VPTYPSNVATVTVTGYWTNSDSGAPATGTVTFTPNAVLQDGTSAPANIVLPKPQAAVLVNGAISVQLMATDDSHLSPSGWVYTVSENIAGQASNRTYQVQLPAAQAPFDLAKVAPLAAPPALVGYVAASAVGAVNGVVSAATLTNKGDLLAATAPGTIGRQAVGTDGQVLAADSTKPTGLAWVTGGGGGSGVPSNAVVAQTSYGQAPSAGAAAAYSRGDHTHGSPPPPYAVLVLSQGGTISASPGTARIYNDAGRALTIMAVRASAGTAPTGAPLIVDIKKTGVTIFTNSANRPTIAAGANTSGKVTNMDVTALADGDYLTVDVAQVGSVVAGSDLVVQIWAA